MASGANCGKPQVRQAPGPELRRYLYSGATLRRRAPSDQFVGAFCLQRIGITCPVLGLKAEAGLVA
jgi:hypothetical protein